MNTKIHFIAKYKVKGIKHYATIQDCVDYISKLDVIGLDIETSVDEKLMHLQTKIHRGGLDPYLSRCIVIQVGDIHHSFVIDARDFTKEELQPILDILHWNEKVLIVGTNLKFEAKHLKHKYGLEMKLVWDTMIVDMNLWNGLEHRFSLADQAYRYLGIQKTSDINLFNTLTENKVVTLDDYNLDNEYTITPFELADDFTIDKATRMEFISIGDKPLTKKQIEYSSDDIVLPILIREEQLKGRTLPCGEVYNPEKLHRMENSFTQVLGEIELNGMPFRKDMWLELYEKNLKVHTQRLKDLNSYVMCMYPTHTAQPNLFTPVPTCMVDWASSKQTISFFKKLSNPNNPEECLCPKAYSKQTKRKDWTVGATELIKLLPNDMKNAYMKDKWVGFEKVGKGQYKIDHHALILSYLLLKKAEQSITTFGKEWLKYVHPVTGRVHSNYRQLLNTGRMSSTSPNLQNCGEVYRACFKTTDEKCMINNDYSSQESRVLADKSGDELFVDFFKNGDAFFGSDFHAYTATKVFKIKENDPDLVVQPKDLPEGGKNALFTEVDDERRFYAKSVNFGASYGKEARSFAIDWGVAEEVADDFMISYYGTFVGLKDFFKKQRRAAVDNCMIHIDDVVDRRWFFPHAKEMQSLKEELDSYYPDGYMTGKLRWSKEKKAEFKAELNETYPQLKAMWKTYFGMVSPLERKGLNYPIQGSASSQIKTSLIMYRIERIENKLEDLKIINVVHDEIVAESSKSNGQVYGQLLEDCMVKGGNIFVKNKIMAADFVVADSWGH